MNFQQLVTSNIKKLRKANNLTQEELAERIGLSGKTISNIERNKYLPSPRTLDKICKVFNIHPSVLLLENSANCTKSELIEAIHARLNTMTSQQLEQILKIAETF